MPVSLERTAGLSAYGDAYHLRAGVEIRWQLRFIERQPDRSRAIWISQRCVLRTGQDMTELGRSPCGHPAI